MMGDNLTMNNNNNNSQQPTENYIATLGTCRVPTPTTNDTYIVVLADEYPLEHAIILFGYLMPVVVILSIVTNLLVVIILTRRHMRNPTNIVLCTLAIVDLLTILIGAPLYFYEYALKHYDDMNEFICYVHHTLIDTLPVLLHNASIWLTLLLAGQRYIYVRYPALASSWCTQQRIKMCVIIILLTAFASQFTRFFDLRFTFVKSRVNESGSWCSVCEQSVEPWVHMIGMDPYFATYFSFRILFVYLVPCTALITLNCLLYHALKRAERRRHALLKCPSNQLDEISKSWTVRQTTTNERKSELLCSNKATTTSTTTKTLPTTSSTLAIARTRETSNHDIGDHENDAGEIAHKIDTASWYHHPTLDRRKIVLVTINGLERDISDRDNLANDEIEETCFCSFDCECNSEGNECSRCDMDETTLPTIATTTKIATSNSNTKVASRPSSSSETPINSRMGKDKITMSSIVSCHSRVSLDNPDSSENSTTPILKASNSGITTNQGHEQVRFLIKEETQKEQVAKGTNDKTTIFDGCSVRPVVEPSMRFCVSSSSFGGASSSQRSGCELETDEDGTKLDDDEDEDGDEDEEDYELGAQSSRLMASSQKESITRSSASLNNFVQPVLMAPVSSQVAASNSQADSSQGLPVISGARRSRLGSINLLKRFSRRRDSNRTTLMLIVVVTVFLAVEVPSAIVTTLHFTTTAFGVLKDNEYLMTFISYTKLYSNFLIMVSYSLNFSIYCSMSYMFRQTFRNLLTFGRAARDEIRTFHSHSHSHG